MAYSDVPKRGYAVCIVNIQPINNSNFETRDGAENDKENFDTIINLLGFESINSDFTVNLGVGYWDHRRGTTENIAVNPKDCCISCRIKSIDHTNSEGFLLALSSHGQETSESEIMFSDGEFVRLTDLFDLLSDDNCKGLTGKPRILLLQCCRSNPNEPPLLDQGNSLTVCTSGEIEILPSMHLTQGELVPFEDSKYIYQFRAETLNIPRHFIIVQPTTAGHNAYRYTNGQNSGSWFITELTAAIRKHYTDNNTKDMNFFHIVSSTAGKVGRDYESYMLENGTVDLAQSGIKNAVCLVHTLTKPLIFKPIRDC